MIVEQEKCLGCEECIPYCPVQAIKVIEEKASIDLDLCVECGACIRSEVCPTQALYLQEMLGQELFGLHSVAPIISDMTNCLRKNQCRNVSSI